MTRYFKEHQASQRTENRAYKVLISLVFGLLGFLVNFYPLNVVIPPHKASFVWGLVFPMLISVSWGWKYGLLSATLGLGGQTMWILWLPKNGWAPFVAIPFYTFWIVWHGWCAEKVKKGILSTFYGAEIPFRILYAVVLVTLFSWSFKFNPSPWAPEMTLTTPPSAFVNFLQFKCIFEGYIVLLLADVLLSFRFVKKILLLKKKSETKSGYIISGALLLGLIFWIVSGIAGYLFSSEDVAFFSSHPNRTLADTLILNVPPHEFFNRISFILIFLVAGLIISKYFFKFKESEVEKAKAYEIIKKSNSIAFLWENAEGWPVQFVSENVLQLTGYTPQEFTSGKISYAQIIHPDDREKVERGVNQGSKDPILEAVGLEPYRIITKDKEIKWISDYCQIRRNEEGRGTHYQGVVEDITLGKEAELALKKSKEDWEKTFNSMSDIITIQDKDMRIVMANKAAYDVFQAKPGELNGKYCYEVFREEDHPCSSCPELITLNDKKTHGGIITHEKLGRIFYVTSSPILDENEEFMHIVHIAKDITDQKRVEEELFQAHKMEAIGTLAGGIAHDFNNILTAIIGFAEMAKLDLSIGNNTTEEIDQVLKASRRAADLVQHILTFSRKLDSRLEPIEPHLIIKESLKMLRASLPTTIEIKENIDSNCGKIMADQTNIHQIIVNLCTNSLHAMEDEKGVLSVSLYRKEISDEEIAGEPDVSPGPFIVLEISDTGHGIDQATIEHIFDPYFTTKEVGKGTGLGLSVIHGIIRSCHGFVRVESEPGETIFYVHIPALQHEVPTVAEAEINELLPTGTERILVVDDESVIVHLNKSVLEQLGYEVTATTQGHDALEKIRSDPDQFDLLITDQTMPNLTGAELAQETLKIKPNMPIILCTGYSSILSKEDALVIGIKKYVRKPLDRKMIAKVCREVLDED